MELSATTKLLKSINCMQVITSFLPVQDLLKFNVLNRRFYNEVVPAIMKYRAVYPKVQAEFHLLMKDKKLYGFALNASMTLKEVDFEEDHWRHDNQYTVDAKP